MPVTVLSATEPRTEEPSRHAMEQAAEWYALLRCGEATEAERSSWQVWLDEHPDHRRAWSYVEAVSRNFSPIHATADPRMTADRLWAASARVLQRRRLLRSIAGLGGAGLLGWATWRHTELPGLALACAADYRTAIGERREVALADGSRVWLNTAAALNQDYSASQRRLHLLRGEVLIATATDAIQRPFYVDTTHGRLQALGTRFTVRLNAQEALVAVYEGAVKVRTAAGASAIVAAGQQLRFSADALAKAEVADIAREAWSRGMLVARDITLAEVVQELRRYRIGHLGVAPEVAGLRVFGNFALSDTDQTLALLAQALPVRIHRRTPWWVSLEARDVPASVGR